MHGVAVAGGFALAFIESSLRAYPLDAWMPFRESLTLVLMIVLMLARPRGLPGRREAVRQARLVLAVELALDRSREHSRASVDSLQYRPSSAAW